MPRFQEEVIDGYFSLEGGMNSGYSPSLIQNNQTAFSVNTTCRGGFIRTRPKFQKLTIDFQGNEDAQAWFQEYPISGQGYFKSPQGVEFLVCCAGGRFFGFTINGYKAVMIEFTPPDKRNTLYSPKVWFQQALQYLICQNGSDVPVIFDGVAGRRSNISNNEVPTGRQMAYINSRLFLIDTTGTQVLPGDLGNETSDSILQYTEINQPASQGGFPLQLPLQMGKVKGIITTAQQDTQAGQGNLLVVSDNAITSLNPITQREQWPNIQLQNVALIGNGFSTNGMAIVNGDVWGRAPDGYRSYLMARREFGQWGNTPQSREIQRILQYDDPTLLEYSSCVYFDNRLLMTVNPKAIPNGCYHMGIAALNFDNISSLAGQSSPAYDGLWTGIQPYGLTVGEFNNQQRCFAFCASEEGNYISEITTQYGDDNEDDPQQAERIQAFFESKSFTWQTAWQPKQLDGAEIFIDQIWGQVDFDLKYRPNQWPCWVDWSTMDVCATKSDCSNLCPTPQFFEEQYRSRMVAPQPNPVIDNITNQLMSKGYEFQIRLQWQGQARIRMIRLTATNRGVNSYINGVAT